MQIEGMAELIPLERDLFRLNILHP
jgi:hypothetical protein